MSQAPSNTAIKSTNYEIVIRINNDGDNYSTDPPLGTKYSGKSITLRIGSTVNDLKGAIASESTGENQTYEVLTNNDVIKNSGNLVTGDKLQVTAENGEQGFYKIWLTIDMNNLSDWDHVNSYVDDPEGDSRNNTNDIIRFWVTNDEEYLFMRFDVVKLHAGKSNLGTALSNSSDMVLDGMIWLQFDHKQDGYSIDSYTLEDVTAGSGEPLSFDYIVMHLNEQNKDTVVAKIDFAYFQSISTPNLNRINNNQVVPLWGQTNQSQQPTSTVADVAPDEGFFNYNTSAGSAIIEDPNFSSENEIVEFSFPDQIGETIINSEENTVSITMPVSTDLSDLIATFTLSDYASASISGTLQVRNRTEIT